MFINNIQLRSYFNQSVQAMVQKNSEISKTDQLRQRCKEAVTYGKEFRDFFYPEMEI